MPGESAQSRVEEPEVLPPEGGSRAARARRSRRRDVNRFSPIALGMAIDVVHVMGRGPIGVMIGMFVAGTLVYAFTTYNELPVRKRLAWASAAALYCLVPRWKFVPVGTLVGAAAQYFRKTNSP